MDSAVNPLPANTKRHHWGRLRWSVLGLTSLALCAVATLAILRPSLIAHYGYDAIRVRLNFAPTAPPPPTPPAAVPIVTDRAIAGAVPIQLTAIGTVQAFNTVNLQTRVDGMITAVLFQEGQVVQKGDALVQIDPRPYQAQFDQATATRDKDQAMLVQAQFDAQRYDRLAQDNFASQQQAQQQRALVSQYAAQVRADAAQVDFAATQLGYTRIVAPISGRIGIRNVDEGNVVHASDTGSLAVITQLQPISVILTLSARMLGRTAVTLGQTDVAVVILAQNGTSVLDRGTVQVVNNSVDSATGTIKLKAVFPNQNMRLWPGDFVRGLITVGERKNAVTIPVAAVRHGPHGDFTWIVTQQNTAHAQPVVIEQTADGRSLVERGIEAGQRVVTDGYYQLEDGIPVSVAEAGNKAATKTPSGR